MARRKQQAEYDPGMDPDVIESFHEARDRELQRESAPLDRYKSRMEEEDNGLSDEEVMAIQRASDIESDDDEFYGISKNQKNDSDSELEDWGGRKDNYYGDDDLENEEDAEAYEKSALRIQKKHLKGMKRSDFFEENDFKEWEKSAKEVEEEEVAKAKGEDDHVRKILDSLPTQDPAKLNESERLQLLETLYPEVIPLSNEYVESRKTLKEIEMELKDKKADPSLKKINTLKHTALSAYIVTLESYFTLFITNISGEQEIDLKDHPVMNGILKGRLLWNNVKNIKPVGEDDDSEDEGSMLSDEINGTLSDKEEQEESDSEDDNEMFNTADLIKSALKVPSKRQRSQEDSSDESDEQEQEDISEQSESESEASEDEDSDLQLDFHSAPSSSARKALLKKKKQLLSNSQAEDYSESVDINDADLHDKLTRKRNLRYYTSKIDQASKRDISKINGDADLPYKERQLERDRRLAEEARLRGLKDDKHTDDADRFSDDENDDNNKQGNEDDNDDEDQQYYNKIKAQSQERKKLRREAHEMAVKAAKQGKLDELLKDDMVGEDGKRAINYQILKNKGLATGKKKKENRNARVKKRVKYADAQKKLKSVRRVYQQPTAAYGGEETGIKKNISRSIKLGKS